ncbi:hypothetical protein CEQ90_19795 [Lewinellaceae bacterium SD302]|nr:hypothetical protein CEQ90_19795 [Lewinellaceae bacterium SD302]
MDKDRIKYILKYYSYLMTEKESAAWRHWKSIYKIKGSQSSLNQKNSKIKILLKKGWVTENVEILNLLDNGIDEFEKKTAIRIDKENKINYNYCPKCGKLTRTPKAKQCRYCRYEWH